MRLVANILSYLFNPILAPTYLFIIILFYFPHTSNLFDFDIKLLRVGYIFVATFLVPLALVLVLMKMGKISAINMPVKSERYIPQIFLCFDYIVSSIFMICKIGFTSSLTLSMFICTISITAITIINLFWKISTHAAGAFGLFSVVTMLFIKHPFPDFNLFYIVIAFLTVAVCLSRLYLKAHTPLQIVGGCILGCASGFSLYGFF